MPKSFGQSLSESQIRLARLFQNNGLTTFSQAVKAFERGNHQQIALWKAQIEERKAAGTFIENYR